MSFICLRNNIISCDFVIFFKIYGDVIFSIDVFKWGICNTIGFIVDVYSDKRRKRKNKIDNA